ncbi:transcriptional regulator [Streptomyces sp. MJM1172]|uniref:transcriptional regulator n=1 Tax=Streptomyces sp. MJM1172 TaxID=1703926 RepID=UPI000ACA5FBE|nr:transcriptional regulator [Streptomyces sp. MJM1172]
MDPDFDEFLHVPARLAVVALLTPADWMEFGFVRDAVGTSDSALSSRSPHWRAPGTSRSRDATPASASPGTGARRSSGTPPL